MTFKRTRFKLNGIPIVIVSNKDTLKAAIDKLKSYNPTCIGLDCEWKPVFDKKLKQNKVSLMQIACADLIILIQIRKLDNVKQSFVDSGICQILESEEIAKVGVGIQGDVDKM